MRDVQYDTLTPPSNLPLTHWLHLEAIRDGAQSCVYHFVVTPDSVLPLRPLTKRTVRNGRRFAGILVGLVGGVTAEQAAEKLSGLLA